MENSVSRILIETTVRQTLKGIQEDPERSIRNLVDMALQFSEGRFQNRFFETAHTLYPMFMPKRTHCPLGHEHRIQQLYLGRQAHPLQ